MPSCAFFKCTNNTKNTSKASGITFHSFPKDVEEKQKWIEVIRIARRDDYWMWNKFTRICSEHFLEDEFYMTKKGRRKIHKTAVPKIQLQEMQPGIDNRTPESSVQQQQSGFNTPCDSISVSSSVFDTPSKAGLKDKIMKLELKNKKWKSEIKLSRQKNRRLENKCVTLKSIVRSLENKDMENKKCKLKIKLSRLKNKRLEKKCVTLKSIVRSLEKKHMISPDSLHELELKAESAELINKIYLTRKGKSDKRKFPPALRKFALTLHFYSATAYMYVRRVFLTALPHPRTLRKWYENSNADPGFTAQAFEVLAEKSKANGERLTCTLVADVIAIRQQTQWDGKRTTGLVDYGIGQTDTDVIATQVYVFVLVCIDQNWKIPVGYFFVNGLPGTRRASLLNICLEKCNDVEVDVIALTFDGCTENLSAARILGCQFEDVNNLITTFKHPSNDSQVAVFLDPCHMLKLVRNTFEANKIIFDGNNQEVQWRLLTNLVKLQESEGLHVGNKLTRHVEFRNQIMKVKLAVQLMSTSVAKALRMCKSMSLPMFQHVEPTENFIEKFNNLFHILNSCKSGKYGYKKPICGANHDRIIAFLNDMELYIKSLKIYNKTICTTKKGVSVNVTNRNITKCQCKMGFIGFLICIKSLKHLIETLIGSKRLAYISTSKISQDHIELLFGLIRSHGGNNSNPNTLQFREIYRKLFHHFQLRSPFTGNSVPLDNYQILTSSAPQALNESLPKNMLPDSPELRLNSNTETNILLETNATVLAELLDSNESDLGNDPSEKCQYIVGYISGFVASQLTKVLKCETCVSSLLSDEKYNFHKLIELKTMGGLAFPSKDLYCVCLRAENCIRKYIKQKGTLYFRSNDDSKYLTNEILKSFLNTSIFSALLSLHSFNHHATLSHRILLMKTIVEKYIKIRLHYLHKTNSAVKIQTKRHRVNKLILFEGV